MVAMMAAVAVTADPSVAIDQAMVVAHPVAVVTVVGTAIVVAHPVVVIAVKLMVANVAILVVVIVDIPAVPLRQLFVVVLVLHHPDPVLTRPLASHLDPIVTQNRTTTPTAIITLTTLID